MCIVEDNRYCWINAMILIRLSAFTIFQQKQNEQTTNRTEKKNNEYCIQTALTYRIPVHLITRWFHFRSFSFHCIIFSLHVSCLIFVPFRYGLYSLWFLLFFFFLLNFCKMWCVCVDFFFSHSPVFDWVLCRQCIYFNEDYSCPSSVFRLFESWFEKMPMRSKYHTSQLLCHSYGSYCFHKIHANS